MKTTLHHVLSAATTHVVSSTLPTVWGSPLRTVPILPLVGFRLFISLSLCRFQHSRVTAAQTTRLIRGSLCVPEPSPKMYVHDDACPRPLPRIWGTAASPQALQDIAAPASSTML